MWGCKCPGKSPQQEVCGWGVVVPSALFPLLCHLRLFEHPGLVPSAVVAPLSGSCPGRGMVICSCGPVTDGELIIVCSFAFPLFALAECVSGS